MKFQKRETWKAISKFTISAFAFFIVLTMFTTPVFAAGKAKTKVSGNIRAKADTSSEAVGSVKANQKIDVISSTTASDGYTWYKIYVDADTTGYIRADLVTDVTGSVSTEKKTDDQKEETKVEDKKEDDKKEETKEDDKKDGETVKVGSGNQQNKETVGEQKGETQYVQISETTALKGKVKGDTVNIRENPSTKAKKVDSLKGGKEVDVVGEALDNNKALWYQIQFDGKTGFIRNDFFEVTEMKEEEPVEEETVEEEEVVPEEPVNNDFEVVYELNAEGIEEWYLYDNVKGTKQSLEKLLAVTEQMQQQEAEAVSKVGTYKIVVIILAAIVLALLIAVTILIFKLRDSYEYEYDDDDYEDEDDDEDEDEDDEEEEEDDEEEYRKNRRESRREAVKTVSNTAKRPASDSNAGSSATKSSASSDAWQSRNFLDVDDDMEFEFLDLK